MASYKSDFNPHARPGESSRSRRLGTYTQTAAATMDRGDTDNASRSGQLATRRGQSTTTTTTTTMTTTNRTHQTGLPRSNLRGPLPISTTPISETKSTGVAKFSSGFGRQASKVASNTKAPELKKKSSRNVLRRKPSLVAQPGASRPTVDRSASLTPARPFQAPPERRPSTELPLKSAHGSNEVVTGPARTRTPAAKDTPRIIPELDRYRTGPVQDTRARSRPDAEVPHRLATQDLPPPTPLLSGTSGYSGVSSNHNRYSGYSGSGYSASPSTRFSESPGPGAYSRDTTPTSMSSQSPGIIAPGKPTTPRLWQVSPATSRPPVARRRAGSFANEVEEPPLDQGLPSLRESVISSSSNSTVKGDGKGKEKRARKQRLAPLPPTPPPRKSSQKLMRTTPKEQESPPTLAEASAKLVTASASGSSLKLRDMPGKSPVNNTPPVRPSRDGAPDLQSQMGESLAVIQSNLASFTFPPDGRQSGHQRKATASPIQPQPALRPSHDTRRPSRNPSPSPAHLPVRELTPGPSGIGIIPDLPPPEDPALSRGTTRRTPSPSISASKSRFGLFGRRAKTAPEVPTLNSHERGSRKGPAAGTGHEGYGRHGFRGRSTSAGSIGASGDRSQSRASSSRDSTGSAQAHDPFLLERMSPVIIAGGGEIIDNRNTSLDLSRTGSNTSLLLGRPSIESNTSSIASSGQERSRTTLWPSALPKEPSKRTSKIAMPNGRRPSDSSDDATTGYTSSLAFRRSILRFNNSTNALTLPRPLNLPARGTSPAMSSIDASIMSDDSQLETKPSVDRGRKAPGTKSKKLEKRTRSPRKWNFFHRSQPSTKVKVESPVQVAVNPTIARAIPHYAMLDSSDEQQEPDVVNLEDILRDAAGLELSNEELDALQFNNYKENLRRIENLHSMMVTPLPEAPTAPTLSASPETTQIVPDLPKSELHLNGEPAPERPSRLPQIGRIPKVMSARPHATSPKSFSRPFARLSLIQPRLDPAPVDKNSVAVGPSPPKPSTPVPMNDASPAKAAPKTDRSRQGSGDSASSGDGPSAHRFLAFSPRKDSEATTNSSGGLSFAGTTAVVPKAGSVLGEDEVWDEYDDLIEADDLKAPVSATSSHGLPFQYEGYESRRARKSRMKAKESPTLNPAPSINEPVGVEQRSRRSAFTTSSVYSADLSMKLREVVETAPTPTTPMSFGDFISGYEDRNNSVYSDSAQKPPRGSQNSPGKCNSPTSYAQSISESGSVSPISQVNLRVGSMTVSKWLTFGHVLFSPAREEIMQLDGSSKPRSILVIDGLGNDDWSFYAAETYPTSTFYNLSPTRPLSASKRNSNSNTFPLTPQNHRQVQYTSPLHKFPFPSSTFHVVVLRFPVAMSEASYRNITAESKRVLKPAGYMEMAILDLDLMNMGNRARRAIRGQKVKMQVADPSISLASASDTILKHVGKRGFKDIKACNVGVPVASTIPSPGQKKQKKEEVSLADMMRDESQVGDEGITKMVAKVGRWWYTRCYETAVLPDEDPLPSIFNDAHLLSECKHWNSSFKLVVAYAQKPASGRRRTASV